MARLPFPGCDKWRIGPGHIELENLILIGIEQVAKVGVQPILGYSQMY